MTKMTVSKRNVAYSADEIRETQRYKDILASGTYNQEDTVIDEIVCQMCFALDGMERMRREIAEGGDLVDGLHGKKGSPAAPVLKAYRQDVAACMDILRKRRDAKPPEEEVDDLAAFNA